MARIRTIKPEVWEDEKFGVLSMLERVVWFNRLTQADDKGRFVASSVAVSASISPFNPPSVRRVGSALKVLDECGMIELYEVRNCPYGHFPRWLDHQKIDRPQRPRYPSPPPSTNDSSSGSSNSSCGDSSGDPIRSDPTSPPNPLKRGNPLLRRLKRGGSAPDGHQSWDAYFGSLAQAQNCSAETARARWVDDMGSNE